jgi:hypothetical protein
VEEEFVDESSKMMSMLMRSSNTEMFIKMLKILHKDSWIEILHQPTIPISMMEIL